MGSVFPRLHLIQIGWMGIRNSCDWHLVATAEPIGPGLYFYWPLITEIEEFEVNRDSLELGIQTLLTFDDVTVVVRCVLEYRIFDVIKAKVECADFSNTVGDFCQVKIAEKIQGWEYKKNRLNIQEFNDELRKSVSRPLRKFGVAVEGCSVIDLAPARAYRNIRDVA